MERYFNTHKLWFKAVSAGIICLFVFSNISYALEPGAARESVHTLSPPSRLSPIISVKVRESGQVIVNENEAAGSRAKEDFQEDAGFIYLSILIGQVLAQSGSMISADGLREKLLKKHISHIDFESFKWQELHKEGNTFCLPYKREGSPETVTLRYYLPGDEPLESRGGAAIPIEIGDAKIMCEGWGAISSRIVPEKGISAGQKDRGKTPFPRAEEASLPETEKTSPLDGKKQIDYRPINAGLLQRMHVEHGMAIKRFVNPDNRPLTAVYGAAGADISNFLLSTNATRGYFISDYSGIFYQLSESELKKCFKDDGPEEYLRKYFNADLYCEKFKWGFANGGTLQNRRKITAAIAFELKAIGVDLSTVKVDSDQGHPRITFDWQYRGAKEQTYSITFINADITRPRQYEEMLEGERIDIYYQRAANETAKDYEKGWGSFICRIYEQMRPGGYLITDDYVCVPEDMAYFDKGPDFPISLKEIKDPEIEDIKHRILLTLMVPAFLAGNSSGYGWDLRIRQKPFAARDAATAPEEIIPTEDLIGRAWQALCDMNEEALKESLCVLESFYGFRWALFVGRRGRRKIEKLLSMKPSEAVAIVEKTNIPGLVKNLGLSDIKASKVIRSLVGLAENVEQHVVTGFGVLLARGIYSEKKGRGVEVVALDNGKGIRDIALAVKEGVSLDKTGGSAGMALTRLVRDMDYVEILSRGRQWFKTKKARDAEMEHGGTKVVARKWAGIKRKAPDPAGPVFELEMPGIITEAHEDFVSGEIRKFIKSIEEVPEGKRVSIDDVLNELARNIMEHGRGGVIRVYAGRDKSGAITGLKIVAVDNGEGLTRDPNELVRDSIKAAEGALRGFGFKRIAFDPDHVVIESKGRKAYGEKWTGISTDENAGLWFAQSGTSDITAGTMITLEFHLIQPPAEFSEVASRIFRALGIVPAKLEWRREKGFDIAEVPLEKLNSYAIRTAFRVLEKDELEGALSIVNHNDKPLFLSLQRTGKDPVVIDLSVYYGDSDKRKAESAKKRKKKLFPDFWPRVLKSAYAYAMFDNSGELIEIKSAPPTDGKAYPPGMTVLSIPVLPGVYTGVNPSSEVSAKAALKYAKPGMKVLVIGTGSGLEARIAAEKGAFVDAVDIKEMAVENTKLTCSLGGAGSRVNAFRNDLFDGLGQYDLIIFNMPHITMPHGSSVDLGTGLITPDDRNVKDFGEAVLKRVAANIAEHMTDGGKAVLVNSYLKYVEELLSEKTGLAVSADSFGLVSNSRAYIISKEKARSGRGDGLQREDPPAEGSPCSMFEILRAKEGFAFAEQIRLETKGGMPDGHLSLEVVKRDLGTLVFLGLVEKDGEGDYAIFRAMELSPAGWEIAEPVLKKLGPRPSAGEKRAAKERLRRRLFSIITLSAAPPEKDVQAVRKAVSRVPRIRNFERDFKFTGLIKTGNSVLRKYEYVGEDKILTNAIELKKGNYYITKDSTLYGHRHGNLEIFLLPQVEILSFINPANTNPCLPKFIGLVPTDGMDGFSSKKVPLFEFIDGRTLEDHARALRLRPLRAVESAFLDLAEKTLKGYRQTYLNNGYVHGDIDPTAIMAVEDNGALKRVVYVDNDTVTPLDKGGRINKIRKWFTKGYYMSGDRINRVKAEDTPTRELCLPRDDVYALCVTLLESIKSTFRKLPDKKRRKPTRKINKLVRALKKYKELSEKENAGDRLLTELIKEVDGIMIGKKRPEPGAVPPTSEGSPYNTFEILRAENRFISAQDIAGKSGLSMEHTIKRDLGVLDRLGLVERKGSGRGAVYRAMVLKPVELEIVTSILKDLGAKPASAETKAAREKLEKGGIIIGPDTVLEEFRKKKIRWPRVMKEARRHLVEILAREAGKKSGEVDTVDLAKQLEAFGGKSLSGLLTFYVRMNGLSGRGSFHRALRIIKKHLGIRNLLPLRRKELRFTEDSWSKTKELLHRYRGYEDLPHGLEKFVKRHFGSLTNADIVALALDAETGNKASFVALHAVCKHAVQGVMNNHKDDIGDHGLSDLLNDVLMKTVLAFGDHKHEIFVPYFQAAFQNALMDHYRRLKRNREVSLTGPIKEDADHIFRRGRLTALTDEEIKELLDLLKEVLPDTRHKERDIQIFKEKYFDDDTTRELMDRYGMSESSVLGVCKNIIDRIAKNTRLKKAFSAIMPGNAGPDGFIWQGVYPLKEFLSRLDDIKKNDITDEYRDRIVRLSGMIDLPQLEIPQYERISLKGLLEGLRKGKTRIYGFESIVNGPDDFFLGRNDEGEELFFATDVITELENRGSPAIVDEYLLHELLCPFLGHYNAILVQQDLFPDNYPDKRKLQEQLKFTPYKGLLGKALRDIIEERLSGRSGLDQGEFEKKYIVSRHAQPPEDLSVLDSVVVTKEEAESPLRRPTVDAKNRKAMEMFKALSPGDAREPIGFDPGVAPVVPQDFRNRAQLAEFLFGELVKNMQEFVSLAQPEADFYFRIEKVKRADGTVGVRIMAVDRGRGIPVPDAFEKPRVRRKYVSPESTLESVRGVFLSGLRRLGRIDDITVEGASRGKGVRYYHDPAGNHADLFESDPNETKISVTMFPSQQFETPISHQPEEKEKAQEREEGAVSTFVMGAKSGDRIKIWIEPADSDEVHQLIQGEYTKMFRWFTQFMKKDDQWKNVDEKYKVLKAYTAKGILEALCVYEMDREGRYGLGPGVCIKILEVARHNTEREKEGRKLRGVGRRMVESLINISLREGGEGRVFIRPQARRAFFKIIGMQTTHSPDFLEWFIFEPDKAWEFAATLDEEIELQREEFLTRPRKLPLMERKDLGHGSRFRIDELPEGIVKTFLQFLRRNDLSRIIIYGGAVRSLLLNKTPSDFDIVIEKEAIQEKTGVNTWDTMSDLAFALSKAGNRIEVEDIPYRLFEKAFLNFRGFPIDVLGVLDEEGNIEPDPMADLSMNRIGFKIVGDEIELIDIHGGIADFKRKAARLVGKKTGEKEKIAPENLHMPQFLRAVQFIDLFDLELTPQTKKLIKECAETYQWEEDPYMKERLEDTLTLIFRFSRNQKATFDLMKELGLVSKLREFGIEPNDFVIKYGPNGMVPFEGPVTVPNLPLPQPEEDNLRADDETAGARGKFRSQLSETRQNDITGQYKDKIISLFKDALKGEELSHEDRSRLQDQLEKLKEYKIYGFKSIMESPDDFILYRNDAEAGELFLATDVIAWLQNHGPPELVDEYLFRTIASPDESKLYEGRLGRSLCNIINWEVTEITQAGAAELDEALSVHNESWVRSKFLQLTKEQMRHLIRQKMVYLLKIKGIEKPVRGVLLTYPLNTGGELAKIEEYPLWDNMFSGKSGKGPFDTLLFWAIGSSKDDATRNINLGQMFIDKAKAHFDDVPYISTFSPAVGFDGFREELEKKGIPEKIIEKYGIFLYLVSLRGGGYETYLRRIAEEGFILPEEFFKEEKAKARDLVENFHVVKNKAVIAAVLPRKEGYTRPDALFTIMYGYKGFKNDVKGFRQLKEWRSIMPPSSERAKAEDREKEHAIDRDAKIAQDFIDTAIVRAFERKKPGEKVIFALGTDWIRGYEKKGSLQHQVLNRLIMALRGFCKSQNIIFIDREDKDLLTAVKTEKAKKGNEDAKVIVLSHENTVTSGEFEALRKDKDIFLAGVDNRNLTENTYSYIMEMLTLAFELAFDPGIDSGDFGITVKKDERFPDIYIFILPKAIPVEFEELRERYRTQETKIRTAA